MVSRYIQTVEGAITRRRTGMEKTAALLASAGASAACVARPIKVLFNALLFAFECLQLRSILLSAATKQRFAGITRLLEQLRRQEAVPESSATLFPHVLPCLRDHNSKIALGALEIFELLVARVTESTLRSYFNLLWISLVSGWGTALLVREKAVDVVVEISVVLDVTTARKTQRLHESQELAHARAGTKAERERESYRLKRGDLMHMVLKLLEDSSKDVRDAAITTLEKFYTFIGPSLLSDLEYKNIRAAHMKTLTSRFEGLSARSNSLAGVVHAAPRVMPNRYVCFNLTVTADVWQLGVIFDKLEIDNNWDTRVDGLKMLQKLANRCSKASNSGTALPFLSQGLRPIRERLCLQVSDLRSSVSREACQTIQTLASTLRDEFNAHAETCLGNLLKATYVTIQVISTAADTTIKVMIESTSDGYARVIPKQVFLIYATFATEKKKSVAGGPLRVWNAPKPSQSTNATVESLYTSRQEPSTAGFHTSSQQQASKAQRIQLAGESHLPVSMDIDEGETSGPKRLPFASMPSPTASNASSSRTNNSKTIPGTLCQSELHRQNRQSNIRSWSTRLEAAEYIGKYLQRRVNQIESGASEDHKVDDRILIAFIKHLSDAHYRVSQGVLKHLLPLLKLSNDSQRLLPHLKTVLPKLFQKFIDTKESIRVVAKENLEYIASTVDSSTLAAIVISMLGDGSNMKVKAAMCHYLRELLPGAEGYMKHGTNNSHMRSFLLKTALLMDTDVPVSVSSACGELVSVASQLYGPEMEVALGLLPPSKRLVVSKILKSKKIVLNFSNPQRPPFSTSSTTPHSARSRDGYNDNQEIPQHPNQSGAASESSAVVERLVAKTMPSENVSFSSAMFSFVGDRVDKHDVQLEDILHILEQNNLPEAELKHALRKTLHFIKNGSSETWDRCFGRLLLLLLDAATENNVYALNLLQRLVEAQPSRAQMFFELLLQRLIDAMVDQVDVVSQSRATELLLVGSNVSCGMVVEQAHHLMERILHDLVSSASDHQQTLSVLIPLGSNREPPMLQVVLRLIKVCFQTCERSSPQESAFLCQHDVADRLMSMLARRVDHASASVRKHAVDCLVAFHFATKEDSSIMPKYLTELDDTRRRLVEIFINRAKMERHHIGLSST
ncbi:CLASP N-terminal domain [Phytophthora cactorum]|nr:CLASP N-terminal domain [Phytophthora cactorum]